MHVTNYCAINNSLNINNFRKIYIIVKVTKKSFDKSKIVFNFSLKKS